jgi:hypothetical protein
LTFENKTKAAAKKEEKKCRETLESEKNWFWMKWKWSYITRCNSDSFCCCCYVRSRTRANYLSFIEREKCCSSKSRLTIKHQNSINDAAW